MAVEPFWHHFWTFNIFELFECFCCWNHCFLIPFFWKNHQVSEGQRRLFHQEIFELFPRGKLLLNFQNLEIKILITSYLKNVCNFQAYIWNQNIMLFIILKNEKIDGGTKSPPILPSTHPSTRPSIHTIKHFGILVSVAEIDISSTLHGTNLIKQKILKWTSYGISALVDSLRGINQGNDTM